MNTADLITAYLNNEMSPEQERQFLLSVAASDSLRLSLKSHVMLDRIVFEQARDTRVPDGVRGAIFAEMSASLAAGSGGSSSASPYADGLRAAASSPGGGVVAAASRFGIVKGLSIAVLALSGFGAGYLTRVSVEAPLPLQAAAAPVLQQNGSQLQSLLASTALLVNIPTASLDVALLDGEASQQVGPGARSEVPQQGRRVQWRATAPSGDTPVKSGGVESNSGVDSKNSTVQPAATLDKDNPLNPSNAKPDDKGSPSAPTQPSSSANNDSGKGAPTIQVDGTVSKSGSTPPSSEEAPKQ